MNSDAWYPPGSVLRLSIHNRNLMPGNIHLPEHVKVNYYGDLTIDLLLQVATLLGLISCGWWSRRLGSLCDAPATTASASIAVIPMGG